MKQITFKLVAYSAAAGKYDPDAPNLGNEDNFYVDDNLSDAEMSNFTPDNLVEMSECGMLMVVADGMGGMNAGEVASEIAIRTVSDLFSPGKITPQIAQNEHERRKYLENAIVAADLNIKQDARANPEHKGMGSTIIIAWLVGDELTVSWCGDSRCYRFNPSVGIEMLSRDHSYVQELADKGIITYEQTFGHPQGNIVTRSLGDESSTAVPETRNFKVYQDDIIMLCSDGLSGVVFDRQYYIDNRLISNDNLEDIIRANQHSMVACREALFAAAEKADWYDNVTVVLCQICNGADPIPQNKPDVDAQYHERPQEESQHSNGGGGSFWSRKKVLLLIASVVIVLLVGGGLLLWPKKQVNKLELPSVDSLQVIKTTLEDSLQKEINDEPNVKNGNPLQKKYNKVTPKNINNNGDSLKELIKTLSVSDESNTDVTNGKQNVSNRKMTIGHYDTVEHKVIRGETILSIARNNGIIPREREKATRIPEDKFHRILQENKEPFKDPNKVKLREKQVIYLLVIKIK